MTYSGQPRDRAVLEPTTENLITEYHDRVRWGPIIAGILVAIATQLLLSALGAAIGFTGVAGTNATAQDFTDVGLGVGIWAIVSWLIGLFVGSWVATSASGPMNSRTALLNGLILWAATLALGTWLVASGVTGIFGAIAANVGEIVNQVQQPGGAGTPGTTVQVTPEQAQQIAANTARAGWSFFIGSLLGLAAALFGSSVGARSPRKYSYPAERTP